MNTWVQVALIIAGAWIAVTVLAVLAWSRMFRNIDRGISSMNRPLR